MRFIHCLQAIQKEQLLFVIRYDYMVWRRRSERNSNSAMTVSSKALDTGVILWIYQFLYSRVSDKVPTHVHTNKYSVSRAVDDIISTFVKFLITRFSSQKVRHLD